MADASSRSVHEDSGVRFVAVRLYPRPDAPVAPGVVWTGLTDSDMRARCGHRVPISGPDCADGSCRMTALPVSALRPSSLPSPAHAASNCCRLCVIGLGRSCCRLRIRHRFSRDEQVHRAVMLNTAVCVRRKAVDRWSGVTVRACSGGKRDEPPRHTAGGGPFGGGEIDEALHRILFGWPSLGSIGSATQPGSRTSQDVPGGRSTSDAWHISFP